MFNPNNMWPSVPPLNPYVYGNQSLNVMPNNILGQNVNQLSYLTPNQAFGQQFNNNYNYLGPTVVPQYNQSLMSSYTHLNQSFPTNTMSQSFPNLRPISTLTTIQTIDYKPMDNSVKCNENEKWLNLLNASQKQILDQLNKETQSFEQQFNNWEKEFENWKRVNRFHPDNSAYHLYINQWQEWRQKLIERQQQMKDLRSRTLQHLYSQVHHKQESPKPPLPLSLPQPPPPPPPEKSTPLPPPPPPPLELNISSQQIDNNRKEDNFRLNSEEMKNKRFKSNVETKDIEIIEIDCDKREEKSETVTTVDPNAVSKAAETFLFIQKQRELLKSLDNLKSVKINDNKSTDINSSSDDIQIIEPKPFIITDIVTKMKAIRPPEDPIEANKILSNFPSLQGIVFQPKPQNESQREPIVATDMNQMHISKPFHSIPANEALRPPIPTPPLNRPHNPSNENHWICPNPSSSRETYYRMNGPQSPQKPNSVRKYSAQTIDYNHRHENRDLNQRIDPSVEMQTYFPPKTDNLFPQINANNSFNHQMFGDFRKPMEGSKLPEMTSIEEPLNYRDIRYFTHPKSRIVAIDDLLRPPTREFRPENIVIILRGIPGSGKTFIAKLIKEKEIEFGRNAPRILSIDDYFMSEIEKQIKIPETGKTVKSKEYVYEYEKEMESCYRASLLKTYKKTVDDRLFPFIIIDAVNELIADIEDFYSYAIKNDFVVYVIEMVSNDPLVCHKNNIHNRSLDDIKQIHKKWQTLPEFMLRLDIRSLLQNACIKNVEMEVNPSESDDSFKRKSEIESNVSDKELKSFRESDDSNDETRVSRWERMEASESKLDKLDSFRMKSKPTIEEYLQVTDDYDLRLKDKQKRVRWADIEEKKKHEKIRERGFVVGVDWNQYMDPQHPQRVLTETKYF